MPLERPLQLGLFGEPCVITVISLWEPWAECCVCERVCGLEFGLAMYEDEIVPDDYTGEWGGRPCCALCYEINRGHVGRPIEPLYGVIPLRELPWAVNT
jgi:hypothetical protein